MISNVCGWRQFGRCFVATNVRDTSFVDAESSPCDLHRGNGQRPFHVAARADAKGPLRRIFLCRLAVGGHASTGARVFTSNVATAIRQSSTCLLSPINVTSSAVQKSSKRSCSLSSRPLARRKNFQTGTCSATSKDASAGRAFF